MRKLFLLMIASLCLSITAKAEMEVQEIPEQPAEFYIDLTEASPTDLQPEVNRPYPSRRCTVYFQQCQIEVFGKCMKWKSRTASVDRRDARYACYYLDRQYGPIRRCRVSCNR